MDESHKRATEGSEQAPDSEDAKGFCLWHHMAAATAALSTGKQTKPNMLRSNAVVLNYILYKANVLAPKSHFIMSDIDLLN